MKRSIFLSLVIAIATAPNCLAKDLTAPVSERAQRIASYFQQLQQSVAQAITDLNGNRRVDLSVYAYAAAFLRLYPRELYPQLTEFDNATSELRSLINPDTYKLLDELADEAYERLVALGYGQQNRN